MGGAKMSQLESDLNGVETGYEIVGFGRGPQGMPPPAAWGKGSAHNAPGSSDKFVELSTGGRHKKVSS